MANGRPSTSPVGENFVRENKEESGNYRDVDYYFDNEGNLKEMDHCQALQLDLNYFDEKLDETRFASHVAALSENYRPMRNPREEEPQKYQQVRERIQEAYKFLGLPWLRNPYLKRLGIYSRFKNEGNQPVFTGTDNDSIRRCFAVNNVYLDEKISAELCEPYQDGRVGLLSKKSEHFYFETTTSYQDSEVKRKGEELRKTLFPNDPENWVIFYISNAPSLDDGGYDLRDVRFVEEELQKKKEVESANTGLPTLHEKLFVINWAVGAYDGACTRISQRKEKEEKDKENKIFSTLLSMTPLEQKYSVEDAYLHDTPYFVRLSRFLESLQQRGDATRPAVMSLDGLVRYYKADKLNDTDKPTIVKECEEKHLSQLHAMHLKICSTFYDIIKGSDEKTQKAILNTILMTIGRNNNIHPSEPKKLSLEYKIEKDQVVIEYGHVTGRRNYGRTYTFSRQKAVINDRDPVQGNSTLTVENGQMTAGASVALDKFVKHLCVPELIDKVRTHVEAPIPPEEEKQLGPDQASTVMGVHPGIQGPALTVQIPQGVLGPSNTTVEVRPPDIAVGPGEDENAIKTAEARAAEARAAARAKAVRAAEAVKADEARAEAARAAERAAERAARAEAARAEAARAEAARAEAARAEAVRAEAARAEAKKEVTTETTEGECENVPFIFAAPSAPPLPFSPGQPSAPPLPVVFPPTTTYRPILWASLQANNNPILTILNEKDQSNTRKIERLIASFPECNEQQILEGVSEILSLAESKKSSEKATLWTVLKRVDGLCSQLNSKQVTSTSGPQETLLPLSPEDKEKMLSYVKAILEKIKVQQKMGCKIARYGLLGLVVAACIVVGLLMAHVAPVLIGVAAGVTALICMLPAAASVYKNYSINKRLSSIAALLNPESARPTFFRHCFT